MSILAIHSLTKSLQSTGKQGFQTWTGYRRTYILNWPSGPIQWKYSKKCWPTQWRSNLGVSKQILLALKLQWARLLQLNRAPSSTAVLKQLCVNTHEFFQVTKKKKKIYICPALYMPLSYIHFTNYRSTEYNDLHSSDKPDLSPCPTHYFSIHWPLLTVHYSLITVHLSMPYDYALLTAHYFWPSFTTFLVIYL